MLCRMLPVDGLQTLTIISLVASILGAILAIVAIVVTLILFFASHKTSLSILDFLADIKSSATKTESSQTSTIERLIEVIAQRSTYDTLEEAEDVSLGVAQVLEHDPGIDDTAKVRLRNNIERVLKSSFKSLTYKLRSIPQEVSDTAISGPSRDIAYTSQQPAGMSRVFRWILRNEGKYDFIGVHFLRATIFRVDPAAQEALQDAIDRNLLTLYKVDNPEKPEWKTTACKLNRDHPEVKRILSSIADASA